MRVSNVTSEKVFFVFKAPTVFPRSVNSHIWMSEDIFFTTKSLKIHTQNNVCLKTCYDFTGMPFCLLNQSTFRSLQPCDSIRLHSIHMSNHWIRNFGSCLSGHRYKLTVENLMVAYYDKSACTFTGWIVCSQWQPFTVHCRLESAAQPNPARLFMSFIIFVAQSYWVLIESAPPPPRHEENRFHLCFF